MSKEACILFTLLLFAAVACGPIYSTEYKFTPPRSTHGPQCISLCESQQDRCEELISQEYDRCENRKERYYTACSDRVVRNKGRAPNSGECGSIESCSSSTSRCDDLYRSCYQSCGGTVVEERTCVANCEKEEN